MTAYTVTAERSGKWWVLQAAEAPGAISQVARLDQADQIIEAIGFVTGEDEADITINVRPILAPAATEHLAMSSRLREEAAAANAAAAVESRAAATTLKEAGLSVRDIGNIMGVSFQRAQQLAATH